MKLANMIMILLVIQGIIMLFNGLMPTEGCIGNCTAEYDLETYNDSSSNSIWNFAVNPTGWKTTNWIVFLLAILGIGIGATFIGTVAGYKGDVLLFFGYFTMFLLIGAIPLMSLYLIITNDPLIFGCDLAGPCFPSQMLFLFTGGILAVLYTLSVIEWWRTGSMGT